MAFCARHDCYFVGCPQCTNDGASDALSAAEQRAAEADAILRAHGMDPEQVGCDVATFAGVVMERDAIRAQRDEVVAVVADLSAWLDCYGGSRFDQGMVEDDVRPFVNRLQSAIARTPAQSLARWQAMARVCEAARMHMEYCGPGAGIGAPSPLRDALSALDQLDREGGREK